jgi:hypothetical protein
VRAISSGSATSGSGIFCGSSRAAGVAWLREVHHGMQPAHACLCGGSSSSVLEAQTALWGALASTALWSALASAALWGALASTALWSALASAALWGAWRLRLCGGPGVYRFVRGLASTGLWSALASAALWGALA